MNRERAQALAWEERWTRPAGLASLAAIVLVGAAIMLATQGVGSSSGDSELLRNVEASRDAQLASSLLQALGIGLLAAPLYFLFRAALARSATMRGQLVGIVVAAPIFLAAMAVLSGLSTLHAASEFADEIPRLLADGGGLDSERANRAANDAIVDAPLRPLAAGFGLGGQLGFLVAMFYTAMHAMRTGLLTRFWGSLGMALGAVSFLFFQFTLLWFVYVGVLLLGWVPGGRPPAWETGEAMPWPTPGERAAEGMDESGEPDELSELPGGGNGADSEGSAGERRKRKQRD